MTVLRRVGRMILSAWLWTVPVLAHAGDCASLASQALPQTRIELAAPVAAGAFTPEGGGRTLNVPAFCRVVGVVARLRGRPRLPARDRR